MSHVPLLVRHAARRLVRTAGLSAAAILTLALGLGATTAVFTLVRGVLLRPLPYPNPDRLVALSHTLVVGGELHADQSDATLLFYRRHNRTFAHLGGYQIVASALASGGGGDAERIATGRVTSDLFPAVGVAPLRGRVFTEDDDRPGAAPVAVIGERLWTRKYGRDPRIGQRGVRVDGVLHEVIGIMPATFRFPAADTEVWIPMRLDPARTESATFDYQAVGRLRDGVSTETAAEDLQALLLQLPDEFPGRMTRSSIAQTRMRATVQPLAALVRGDSARVLWPILGAALLVLAIACANVANLFLVRAESRHHAVAIQRALGATRQAVVAEFAGEALLVATAGGGIGVLLANAGVAALRSLDGVLDLPRLHEVTIDPIVLASAAAGTMATAMLLTLLPAWRYGGASITHGTGAAGQAATATRERHRLRYALVVVQVALSLMLLAGSGLLARSVWRLRLAEPGFAPAHAITFRLALPTATYPDNDVAVRLFTAAADSMAGIAGVRNVAVVSKLPLDERGRTDTAVFVEDRPLAAGALPGIHPLVYSTPGYFTAAGIPLVAGRTFSRADPPAVALEAVVSRAFAERYWPGASPIGRRIRTYVRGPWFTIVGVAGNVRDGSLDRPPDQMIYCPLLPPREDPRWAPRDLAFVVRAEGEPGALAGPVRDAVRRLAPSLPIYRIATLADILSHAYARRSFTLVLMACATSAAILLAVIGLYGVIAFVVSLRTREIGIRLALGARPDEVRRLVWTQAVVVAAVGVAAGLGGAMVVGRSLSALLFEVSATDPAVFAASAALLLAIAAVASWIPARRASAIEPATALRAE